VVNNKRRFFLIEENIFSHPPELNIFIEVIENVDHIH